MFKSSRTILAFNGLLMILLGLIFFFFGEKITIQMFPNIISNPEAINASTSLRILIGISYIFIGLILFLARISIKSTAQRILFGSSIGFFLMFLTLLYIQLSQKGNIPILVLIIFSSLSLLSIYVATRKYQE